MIFQICTGCGFAGLAPSHQILKEYTNKNKLCTVQHKRELQRYKDCAGIGKIRKAQDMLEMVLYATMCTSECSGALGNAGYVSAAAVGLTAGNGDTSPSPASARGRAAASDNDIVSAAGHSTGTSDVLDCQASDGDAGAGGTMKITAIVVLLNQDAVAI